MAKMKLWFKFNYIELNYFMAKSEYIDKYEV
jgi:hypothetical protein